MSSLELQRPPVVGIDMGRRSAAGRLLVLLLACFAVSTVLAAEKNSDVRKLKAKWLPKKRGSNSSANVRPATESNVPLKRSNNKTGKHRPVCHFVGRGICKNGDNCKFFHPGPRARKAISPSKSGDDSSTVQSSNNGSETTFVDAAEDVVNPERSKSHTSTSTEESTDAPVASSEVDDSNTKPAQLPIEAAVADMKLSQEHLSQSLTETPLDYNHEMMAQMVEKLVDSTGLNRSDSEEADQYNYDTFGPLSLQDNARLTVTPSNRPAGPENLDSSDYGLFTNRAIRFDQTQIFSLDSNTEMKSHDYVLDQKRSEMPSLLCSAPTALHVIGASMNPGDPGTLVRVIDAITGEPVFPNGAILYGLSPFGHVNPAMHPPPFYMQQSPAMHPFPFSNFPTPLKFGTLSQPVSPYGFGHLSGPPTQPMYAQNMGPAQTFDLQINDFTVPSAASHPQRLPPTNGVAFETMPGLKNVDS